jgi:choline dehydrogenase
MEYHGKEGDWMMDDVKYQNILSKRFLEVGQSYGLIYNHDFNHWGTSQEGIGRFQVSEYKGERVSGATAFLSKTLARNNVIIRTGTMVRKINFDVTKTATSVNYDLVGDDSMTVSTRHFFVLTFDFEDFWNHFFFLFVTK